MCIIKLPESLQNMQESETEQVEIAKGIICSFTCYVRGHILFLSLHIKKKQRKNICSVYLGYFTFTFCSNSKIDFACYAPINVMPVGGKAEHGVGI